VLGVAGLVAILAHVSQTDPVASYRNGLLLIIGFFVAAGATAAALLTPRSAPALSIRAVGQTPPAAPVPPAITEAGRTPSP